MLRALKIFFLVSVAVLFSASTCGCGREAQGAVSGGTVDLSENIMSEVPDEASVSVTEELATAVSEAEATEPTAAEAAKETEGITTTVEITAATTVTPEKSNGMTLGDTVESASMTMYAKSAVNVRSGSSTHYERIGHLNAGQEVTVTGIASTGWYEIDYEGSAGFVSNSYLVSDKPETTTVTMASTTVTETTVAEHEGPVIEVSIERTEVSMSEFPLKLQITVTNTSNTAEYRGDYHYTIEYFDGDTWVLPYPPPDTDEELVLLPDESLSLSLFLNYPSKEDDKVYFTAGECRIDYGYYAYFTVADG